MALMEAGRVCVQKSGRKAGNVVVVLEVQKNTAWVEGARTKRKKCNVAHLHPTHQKIAVGKNASREDVVKALNAISWNE